MAMTFIRRFTKTLADYSLALVLVIACFPLFLAAVLVIKSFSRGPLLYVQDRIGFNGCRFQIFKFRTMTVGADETGSGSVTVRSDPRVFFGAGFLRRTKIDELPQLFNVLNGTMSLVGPRPTVDEDYQRMSEEQRRRFSVKPGLTGLAQVRGNTALSWPERIEHDCWYIDHQGTWLDFSILLRTVLLLVTVQADSHPPTSDEWAGDRGNDSASEPVRPAA
tara:strand:- start:402 stop:1061 length:660 start_codon:yes stop_codon:yes gene_type:complete